MILLKILIIILFQTWIHEPKEKLWQFHVIEPRMLEKIHVVLIMQNGL